MNAVVAVIGVAGCCCAGAAAGLAALAGQERRKKHRLRETALGTLSDDGRMTAGSSEGRGWALRYAESLTRRLFTGATQPLAPSVRNKRAGETRAGAKYKQQAVAAGCAKDVTVSAYYEARLRLAAIGAAAGALFGMLFSAEMAVLLAVAGFAFGITALSRDVNAARRNRAAGAERHLSEMLEVVALGLRSGLTFDRSFELYGSHFDNEFARECAKTRRRWALGLTTREEALRDFAASYDCDELGRVVDSIVRSLRFGSALAGILEEAASQSRATYRTNLEERVAKAPVKMMLPTGALILPAMLLLVMGPILLELAGDF
ncbi:MAG: type II secretion system F family protein [Eggerthellaceae bacterium]|nr:type II secretion system F family protein [Eggerthellaceae bacterium]MBQ9044277.1 type II secretion system F family protein [Eggerthellaceae bacterium]